VPEVHYSAGLGEGVLVVSGSAFVVVRGRLDSEHAERIWAALRDERTLAEVLDAVTRGRLGELPDFVVCVPNANGGSRIVQRPGLGIVTIDPSGARETHSAQDSALWSERSVPVDRSIEVDLTGAGADAGTLPLASGAVPATFVRWAPVVVARPSAAEPAGALATVPGAHELLSLVAPDEEEPQPAAVEPEPGASLVATELPALPEPPAVVADLGDAEPAVPEEQGDVDDPDDGDVHGEVEAVDAVAGGFTMSGAYTITEEQLASAGSQDDPGRAEAQLSPEADPYDSLFGATTHRSVEGAAVRSGSEQPRTDEPRAEATEHVYPLDSSAAEPVPVPHPDGADEGRSVDTIGDGPLIDSVPVVGSGSPPGVVPASPPPGDHDGLTISAASLRQLRHEERPTDRPAPAAAMPVVHAITCTAGHPNPPQSGTCRVCGSPLAFQEPITVPRPPLGVLVFAGGHEVTLDRYVLVGRSPAVERVAPGDLPHLVKLDSPDKDVSRNHVEIRLEGWHVLVVDLQSTNGTVVQLPGRPPERVHPLEPYAIVPGTVVTVGDEQSFVYEVRG
jgi:hypothetical protein